MSTDTALTRLPPGPPARMHYGPIEAEMQEVERILQAEFRSEHPYVDELVRYVGFLGGKRLRPALLLLTGKAVGEVHRAHLVLAAVVEMIHTATLVHDDVLDEAETRRHLATVNARWDNETSVLLGDFMFTHALYLASSVDSIAACRILAAATNRVCEGELRQKGTRGDYGLTEATYLSIIEGKTAALCACSCRLGAYFSNAAPAVIEQMDAYGRNLGIAFQIADDLLDVEGDESTTGKSLGTDLVKQKPTLPIIHLLNTASAPDQKRARAILQNGGEGRLAALRPYLDHTRALDYSRDRAHYYAAQARAQLDGLPASPALDAMRQLTDFVVVRPA